MGIYNGIVRQEKYERDFFQTPKKAVELLLRNINIKKDCKILDCCCGERVIGNTLKEYGFTNITEFDKYPVNDTIKKQDFLNYNEKHDVTIMNPPYKLKKQFIRKALELSHIVYCFLPIQVENYIDFTEEFLDTNFFAGKIQIYPKMILNQTQDFIQGGITAYAWYEFRNNRFNNIKYIRYADMRVKNDL